MAPSMSTPFLAAIVAPVSASMPADHYSEVTNLACISYIVQSSQAVGDLDLYFDL